jgi:histone acetyltransferase (RNA polymerase elongator complex component)
MNASLLELIDTMLTQLSQNETVVDKESFQKLQNSLYRGKGITAPIPNIALIERYRDLIDRQVLVYSPRVWKILRRRAVRSLSGVAVISFLTKSFGCPGKCTYCPTYE